MSSSFSRSYILQNPLHKRADEYDIFGGFVWSFTVLITALNKHSVMSCRVKLRLEMYAIVAGVRHPHRV